MLALDVRHLDLGIVTALTAVLAAAALPAGTPPSAPGMPGPSPELISVRAPNVHNVSMRYEEAAQAPCSADDVTAVVVRGRISALDPDTMATFHFRFADLPSRYLVTTGARGAFEVRIARDELGELDLCSLPRSGQRPARFQDASMTLTYEVALER